MALQDQINKLREDILARGNEPVPAAYQGVTKDRITDVLCEIDRYTPDHAVFALLDDVSPSFYKIQYKHFPANVRFCDGATVAHVGCHFASGFWGQYTYLNWMEEKSRLLGTV